MTAPALRYAIDIDPDTGVISFGEALPPDCDIKPMLARRVNLAKLKFPVMAQPKFNGVRCITTRDGLFTRYGRRITSLLHIEDALIPVFRAWPDLVLDGELFAPGVSLGGIAADVRTIAKVSSRLGLHVFDVVAPDAFPDRIEAARAAVAAAASHHVEIVETVRIRNLTGLSVHYRACLAAGHEGQMIRIPAAGYKHCRTTLLLKRKPFEDDEADVIGINVVNDEAIHATLQTKAGVVFKAPISATRNDRMLLARHRWQAKSWTATYRFCGLLPSGKPRDPSIATIHRFGRV